MTENCPICNPPKPEEVDLVAALRARIEMDREYPNRQQKLFQRALNEIERLRVTVKSMTGQLAHIGHLGTTMADNVKRNYKIDGGWEP